MIASSTQKKLTKTKGLKILFYACLLALPLLQYFIFYVCVNANMVKLAFTEYDELTFNSTFIWFDNFRQAFINIGTPVFGLRFRNSAIAYCMSLFLTFPLSLIFSYYIYKKGILSGFFQTILYFPNIISAVSLVVIFKFFFDDCVPEIWRILFSADIGKVYSEHSFGVVVFYTLFTSFGTQAVLYASSMSRINASLVEAAEVDGISYFGEFIHITLPLIYGTITTFLVVGLAGFFTNQMHIYTFMGINAPDTMQTLGVYLYLRTKAATGQLSLLNGISAMCLLFSLFIAPITLLVKRFLEKRDPVNN